MPETSSKTAKAPKPRRLKRPGYRLFWPGKRRVKPPLGKLPSAFKLLLKTLSIMEKHWKAFGIIALVYMLLSLLLVKGVAGSADIPAIKEAVTNALQGKGGDLKISFSVFGLLLGTTGNPSSQAGSVYQMVLFVCISLVSIWAFRQAYANAAFTAKDAFYKGMTPLVPFLGIMLVMGLQLVPLLLANLLYNVVIVGGTAQSTIERVIWAIELLVLTVWSAYMVTRSIVALYIVTLPEAPLRALKSARELVRYRRWTILRKMLFLPLALLIIVAAIMLPVILLLAPIAEWVFSIIGALCLVTVHGYLYTLYRELL